MNTTFMLMAQYNGLSVIPVALVCRDYFTHLTPEKFIRKVQEGDIEIPMLRLEDSQKSAKGVHIIDLASYLDARRTAAQKECRQLRSA